MAIWFKILHLEIANGEKHSENQDKTFYSLFADSASARWYVYTYNNDNTISIFFSECFDRSEKELAPLFIEMAPIQTSYRYFFH